MTTLYKLDAKQAVRFWSIEQNWGELTISHGVLGGTAQTQNEYIEEGKQGRDIAEQAAHRMQSRINKRLDMGYVYGPPEDLQKSVNTLGLHKPMLAHKIKGSPNWPYFYVQRKYDGHRCLIHRRSEHQYVAYTRNGKVIESVNHLVQQLDIPVGMTIDGELYSHGHSFQQISSWIKRLQPSSQFLDYHAYDILSDEAYEQRFEQLGMYCPQFRVPTWKLYELEKCFSHFRHFRADGYEGAILRHPFMPYETDKRSKSLLKIKETMDAEFTVLDIVASADGWGILICELPNGSFRVTAPGTIAHKAWTLNNKDLFVGKKITVEYANMTKDGKPFHPVALRWYEGL